MLLVIEVKGFIFYFEAHHIVLSKQVDNFGGCPNQHTMTVVKTKQFKVILYSYLILKKMNERITDS